MDWHLQAVSKDRTRALLWALRGGRPARLRIVEIATNKIDVDLELPALTRVVEGDERGIAAAELPAELRQVASALVPFPLGAGGKIAVGPDGKRVAFNADRWIYATPDPAAPPVRVAAGPAAYTPWFTPDGKNLIFRRHVGRFPNGNGRYELAVTSSDGKSAVQRLAGTEEPWEVFRTPDARTVRVYGTYAPYLRTCVGDIELAAPFTVTRRACLDGNDKILECKWSPSGGKLACRSGFEIAYWPVFFHRLRVMDAVTGALSLDRSWIGLEPGPWPIAVADSGAVAVRKDLTTPALERIDPAGRSKLFATPSYTGEFVDDTHLVVLEGDRFRVIDTR
ncbi:MAG: hypothetical protein KF773_32370 [Deltaproteobacteria bacterium]|nr:hypothetical protein [Deltaproteobacteria bacterium]